MTIQDLINACQRRLSYLSEMRQAALATGDLERVTSLDFEAAQTQSTLNQLMPLA